MSYIDEERKRYNRAVGVAEYILEGNTKKEAMKEFRVSRDTIDRDLDFLKNCYYGNEKRNLQLYIKVKKPFQVEDRIEVKDIKGDVMNISYLNFEVLEISNKEEHGQSTGVIVTFPNSIVCSEPVRNLNKGFKYVWDELTVKVPIDCDLAKNKQELYKIVNNIEIIRNIPKKMKSQINDINTTNRVYFNKYDPTIYTKIVDDHIELTIRYLMHPKKGRFVESVIWNKILEAYKEGNIDLFPAITKES